MGVMLVSDMQRAVGEKLFNLPQFAQWAKKIADVMIFDMWKKPAKNGDGEIKSFTGLTRYNSAGRIFQDLQD